MPYFFGYSTSAKDIHFYSSTYRVLQSPRAYRLITDIQISVDDRFIVETNCTACWDLSQFAIFWYYVWATLLSATRTENR